MKKEIAAATISTIIGAGILGLVGWLGRGVLVSSLGGVAEADFTAHRTNTESRLGALERVLDRGTRGSIWEEVELVKRTYDSQVDVAFGTDEVGDRYAVISQGQGTRMTLRENEIMLKSAFVTADTDPSKWIQMADGSLLYPVDVSFEEPFFATKPNVIVAVTGFQYSPHAVNQAILVEAKNTLPDGFKIHFSSRPGASITQIHAHWLAYGSRQD